MASIHELGRSDFLAFQDRISQETEGATSLEDAAQRYISQIYDGLTESVVLARLFATIPFSLLPAENQSFVQRLAESASVADLVRPQTPVLSLLGTRGTHPEWNDRRASQGHVGIPLASSAFVDRIPMISRLLKQLGAGIAWLDAADTAIVSRTFQNLSGVFYARDAGQELDNKGRKVIAAQDFVEEAGVKTVFGIGGGYLGSATFFTTIVFTRELLEKKTAECFMVQATKFKTATLGLVADDRFFS